MKTFTIILVISALTLIGCKNDKTSYTYYDSGRVKESFYHPDKNNMDKFEASFFDTSGILIATTNYANKQKNGEAKEFFSNGIVKTKLHFRNNQLHGLYQRFNEKGEIKFEILYLNGTKVALREYYSSSDGIYDKFIGYKIKNDTVYIEEGQLVYNNNLLHHDTAMSFYYHLSKDYKEIDTSNSVCIDMVNRYQWNLSFYRYSDTINFNNLSKIEKVEPLRISKNRLVLGLDSFNRIDNLLFGILEIKSTSINDSTIAKRFIVYDTIDK